MLVSMIVSAMVISGILEVGAQPVRVEAKAGSENDFRKIVEQIETISVSLGAPKVGKIDIDCSICFDILII